MKRIHILVSGRVQRVFFRRGAVKVAGKLGLLGWVKNLNDGRVEIVAEGSKEKLMCFIEWLKKGPLIAKVTDIVIKEESPSGKFDSFERRPTE